MPRRPTSADSVRLEPLEERRLLATYMVDNGGDRSDGKYGEGQFSLREAVDFANAAPGEDTIRFASSMSIISLIADLTLTDDVRIEFIDEFGAPNRFQVQSTRGSNDLVIDDDDDAHSIHVTIDGLQSYTEQGGAQAVGIRSRESLTVLNTRISEYNHASAALAHTGTTPDAFLVVRNSMFNRVGTSSGAALAVSGVASVELDRCTFTRSRNGAIAIEDATTVRIVNSTISDNSGEGVRLDLPDGDAVISNGTIASNTSGGVAIEAGSLTLNSTILAYNTIDDAPAELTIGLGAELDIASSRNNLVFDEASAGWLTDGLNGNILGVDPLLAPLADNGGLWQTHALLEGSPAIDKGNNDLGLTTDQRGVPYRRESGTADIGAYERQTLASLLVVDSLLDTDDSDFSAGELTLREAIAWSNATPETETIRFSPDLHGSTIVIGDSLAIGRSVSIEGPGMDLLTLDGNGGSRLLRVGAQIVDDASVTISGLTLANAATALRSWDNTVLERVRVTGCGGSAPAIVNSDFLSIVDSQIVNNHSDGDAGAIYSTYPLSISGSTISDNTAAGDGGAIWARGLGISNSTLSHNSAGGSGGAIWTALRLTVNGCMISLNTAGEDGGAIYAEPGLGSGAYSIVLTQTRFEENDAERRGGAIWGRSELTGCTLVSNTAGSAGGAIWADRVEVIDSTFERNQAEEGGAIFVNETFDVAGSAFVGNSATTRGGAIAAHLRWPGADTMPVTSSSFTANLAGADGGAIFTTAALSVVGSTLSENSAARGGAIFVQESLTIQRSTFDANRATGSGGAIDFDGSEEAAALLDASLLVGNHAGDDGGAIRTVARLTAINCTLSGNSAAYGGAIAILADTTTLRFCTIAHNTAQQAGGAVYIDDTSGGGLLVTRSTLYAFNLANELPSTFADTGGLGIDDASDHNLVDATRDAGGLIDGQLGNIVGVAPGILPLADNGGPTLTHALEPDSPAIDAAGNPVPTDQRAVSRFIDEAADIGAYEWAMLTAREGSTLTVSSDADAQHHVVAWSVDGPWVVFTGAGETWSAEFLDNGDAGHPIGDAVTWTDASGRAVIAGPTAEGLLLFEQTDGGVWTSRNLSSELGVAAESPARALTTIRTRDGSIIVAGYNAAGEIVAFRELPTDGSAAWTFINISDDLASQGMTTPDLDSLVGYATPWDAWNLAGIDASGDIQAVWVFTDHFTTWRADNLSAITGAGPLTGQLSVTQTSWNAINLGGLDADGRLMVTWWVPGGSWTTSDLSAASDAPTLTQGQLTGFVTPWGAINYVGVDTDGRVIAIWWTPSTDWSADTLLDETLAPSGPLTGHTASDRSISILSASDRGEVLRIWWMPGASWTLSNLSDLAAG